MGEHATGENVDGRHGDDVGATFIEMLVSIVLLGIAGVAILVAATAAIAGARTNDQIAKTQAALAEAVDFVTDTEPESVPYQPCETPGVQAAYQAALDARFGGGTIQVVTVLFWDRTAGTAATGDFGAVCRNASDGDRIQRVRLRSITNGSTREVDAVKRPVDIPTLNTIAAPAPPPYTGGSGQANVNLTTGMP